MTTTEQHFEPVVDPETGEVLAATEADRRDLIDLYCRQIIDAEAAAVAARSARRGLHLLMGVGDAWSDPDRPGWAVLVKPPATPARQVVPAALDEHREALAPLGLAPRVEVVERRVDPKVSDLTSKSAREALARVGLTPESLLYQPAPGDPKIEVVAPEVLQ
ncbi:MAG: hypothetical protein AB7G65_19270 [Thermoleophilia bacterium]